MLQFECNVCINVIKMSNVIVNLVTAMDVFVTDERIHPPSDEAGRFPTGNCHQPYGRKKNKII